MVAAAALIVSLLPDSGSSLPLQKAPVGGGRKGYGLCSEPPGHPSGLITVGWQVFRGFFPGPCSSNGFGWFLKCSLRKRDLCTLC